MVARISGETFGSESQTPEPDPSDSDDVCRSLERARIYEAQGALREAAQWLRNAADRAERRGHDDRVLVFARAAADMMNKAPLTPATSTRTVAGAPPRPTGVPRVASPPMPSVRAPSVSGVAASPDRRGGPARRTSTVRVAIPASSGNAPVFVVRRLAPGQALPAGSMEATLVLDGDPE